MDSNVDYAQRDDTTISKLSIDEVLKNAPRKDGNFFSVKKIIDEEWFNEENVHWKYC